MEPDAKPDPFKLIEYPAKPYDQMTHLEKLTSVYCDYYEKEIDRDFD